MWALTRRKNYISQFPLLKLDCETIQMNEHGYIQALAQQQAVLDKPVLYNNDIVVCSNRYFKCGVRGDITMLVHGWWCVLTQPAMIDLPELYGEAAVAKE